MSQTLKIAYFLGKFPQLTQTFVTREVYWIRKHDVNPFVFSLSQPRILPAQDEIEELLPLIHYSPFFNWDVFLAQVHVLFRFPIRYLKALLNLILSTLWEPSLMIRALFAFPKTVYFAQKARALGIHHIHAHFLMLSSISAGVVADLLNIKYSVTVHAVDLFTRNRNNIRRQMERASKVIAISTYNKKYILDLFPNIPEDHIQIIYCGLEAEQFQPADFNHAKKHVPQILSIGRLIQKKGFEYLIDACAILAKEGVDFQCKIIGDGPLKDVLQTRINQHGLRDQVILLGALEQPAVLDNFHGSDVFALSCVIGDDGNRDGLPVVLIEAMSCGLPVVTTPVAGITDLVKHRETGLLVKEKDAVVLADALREIVGNENLRSELGHQGREKVLQDFQIQQTAGKLAAVFQQLINEN